MGSRILAASLGLAVVLVLPGNLPAQEKKNDATPPAKAEETPGPGTSKDTPKKPRIEKATFGGGCFWSIEAIFERVPGVKSVVSGFSGGSVAFPSYETVCTGQTGHAEVVQVEYDASIVPYDKLLHVFWAAHDPTTLNAQGDDVGTQYRSIIFYHSEAQRKAALKSYQELTSRRAFRAPIVTDLAPFTAFYPAEPYHQDYYDHHRDGHYSFIYIDPKLKKLRQKGVLPPPSRARTGSKSATAGH